MWVEINNRANYPVKDALVKMVEQQMIDLEDSATQFALLGFDESVPGWSFRSSWSVESTSDSK